MRRIHLVAILVLLALALPSSAHAGGGVSVCDEAHLLSALSGGGTVEFSCSGTIALTSTITISTDTTIDGTGQAVTISGNNSVGVFKVNSGVTLTLNQLIIANGRADAGGGVFISSGTLMVSNSTFSGNSADLYGGAIYGSGGQVTVSDSTFTGNGSSFLGGGIYNDGGTLAVSRSSFTGNSAAQHGGGIASTGTASVSDSTFSGNHSDQRGGAIVTATGSMTVGNSTFSGNNAPYGGGIANTNAGTLTVINSTLSGNSGCGGVVCLFGAMYNDGATAILQNTIVANSVGFMNCDGYFSDGGGNLSYPDGSCPGINADPLLGPLQDNGGPTQTMALGAGSPAIDAGVSTACQNATINNHDQRGYARFVDGNGDGVAQCDIGAFEYGTSSPPAPTLDPDPPETTIELTPATPDGASGWYRSPVTVKPQASDASLVIDLRCALDPASSPAAFDDLPEEICPFLGGAPVTTDGEHTFYAAAMDIWGNRGEPVSTGFQIDATPPVLTCPAAGPFLLHSGDQPVGPAGVDASVSGLDEAASTLTGIITTESVGPQTLAFTAFDLAGNSASRDCTYAVIYDFGGFYPPVEPAPALNMAKAGQSVPLKFSLGSDQGLNVIAAGYPTSQQVKCTTLEPVGQASPIKPAGQSGLSYAAGNGWYSYVGKTDKGWAGTCRVLTLQLDDATQHPAYFQFK